MSSEKNQRFKVSLSNKFKPFDDQEFLKWMSQYGESNVLTTVYGSLFSTIPTEAIREITQNKQYVENIAQLVKESMEYKELRRGLPDDKEGRLFLHILRYELYL